MEKGPLPRSLASLPLNTPHTWPVPWRGLLYSGEVVLADGWSPEWGRHLTGDCFFRVVFLTRPLKGPRPSLEDARIAVCSPRRRTGPAQERARRELGAIREARLTYLTGRDALTVRMRHALGQQEEALLRELARQEAQAYAQGEIYGPEGLPPAEALFQGDDPALWIQAVAQALLHCAYPEPFFDPSSFPAPFTPEEARLVFEGLFHRQPHPSARTAVSKFGPGLGLVPPDFEGAHTLEALREALGAHLGEVPRAALEAGIAHRHGIPYYLLALYLLAFVARGAPEAELALALPHPLLMRDGQPYPGDRVTAEVLPDLLWHPQMALWVRSLHIPAVPSWRTVLPYALRVEPGLDPQVPPEGEPHQQARLMEALRALGQRARSALEGLSRMSAEMGETLEEGVRESLEALATACSALHPNDFYERARAHFGPPSALGEALELLGRAERVLALRPRVVRSAQYLREAVAGPARRELSLDREALRAQMSLANLLASPSLWPGLEQFFQRYRCRYARAYREHHRRHRQTALHLRGQLGRALPVAEALERLNTLTELGPAVSPQAPERLKGLLRSLHPCDQSEDTLPLEERPLCPSCRVRLDQEPPQEEVKAVTAEVEGALQARCRELASFAVRQVLSQTRVPALERFLRAVQASDTRHLAEVLDERVLEFLRSFLRQR